MLDIKKQYIVQAISNAANNLRLSSEKIEVVTLLREHFIDVDDLETEISRLKKITEFSKLAVRLSEIYNYISGSMIDFNRISEQFKEQSHGLVRELSNLLDVVTPLSFAKIIEGKKQEQLNIDLTGEGRSSIRLEDLHSDSLVTASKTVNEVKEETDISRVPNKNSTDDIEKNLKAEFNYDLFVKSVLEPITALDAFLQELQRGNRDKEKIEFFYDKMIQNKNLSQKAGLEIVAKMHTLLYRAFDLIRVHEFALTKDNIESLRACLIVIVAVVREKDVDISLFLDKAERLNYLLETN